MTDDTPTQSSDRLDQIIAEYLAAEESGAAPPPSDVVAANPELAAELRNFFANREELAVALPNEPPRKRFVPPRVRYFGDYELIDEIARGGMGVVYRAKQTSLNRIVAIKMILAGHLAGEDDVKRFRTEAEAAGRLKHPGIVPVHEVGVHEGHHYFSMDYIEGRSLAEIVRENPLAVRKAAEYVRSIADAVEYAHQQGTLHRDLKPSNVLVDGDDQVHVTDFGLAVRVDGDSELTRTGDILGTPAYMPPEQAQAKRGLIGPGSDVYSLGAILYELLTGRQPLRGESPVETLKLVIEAEPVTPRLLNPKVPRDLETICLKCLQKEPHKRYVTAADLAEELRRFLEGEPIQARPVGRIERAWRWCQRKPAAAGLLASIVLLVIGVVGGALWYVNDRGQRRLAELQREAEEAQRLAVEEAEESSRLDLVEQRIENAVEIAESHRAQALTLTDRPTEWGAVLDSARAEYRQAVAEIDREGEEIALVLRRRVDELGRELDADEQDQQLAVRYDEIYLSAADVDVTDSSYRTEDYFPQFREALATFGLPMVKTPISAAADRILNRPPPVQATWIAVLDECLSNPRAEPAAADWAREVLEIVDPGPWRDPVRGALARRNVSELKRLAAEADLEIHPTWLLRIIAMILNEEGLPLLTRLHSADPGDFWVNLEAARAHRDLGQTEQAVRYYYAALAVRPGNAKITLELAVTFRRAGDLVAAEAAARRAIALEPALAESRLTLGALLASRGEVDQAIALYETALELQPNLSAAHTNLGIEFSRLGDLDGATDRIRRAIKINPRDARFHSALGHVLESSGDLTGAIDAMEQAARLNPRASQDLLYVAVLRRYTDDIPGYRAACRTLFERFHESNDALDLARLLHAHLLFREGARPELLELARRLADGGDTDDLWLLSLAYYRSGDVTETPVLPDEAVVATMDPHPGICFHLGLALVQLRAEQLEEARASIREALQIREAHCDESCAWPPWDPTIYLWGEVSDAMETKGLSVAVPDPPPTYDEFLPALVQRFRQFVKSAPTYPPMYVNLGNAHRMAGNLEAAIEVFHQATEIGPNYARAWTQLGDAYMRRGDEGDEERAIAAFRRAVDLQPDDPHARADLGRALRQSGALADAIAAYQRAYELIPDDATIQRQFVETCFDVGQPQTAIAAVRRRVSTNPDSHKAHLLLAQLLRYTGDDSAYRAACRTMLRDFSGADVPSRHSLVSAWLFFPEGEPVTPELLEIARTNAERGGWVHKRMLGLAYYRLGDYEQALPILKEVGAVNLIPTSRMGSLLCLALVQLRLEQFDDARETLQVAYGAYTGSSGQDEALDPFPWTPVPSLWREVQQEMPDDMDVPIPELPPTYEEWKTHAESQTQSASDTED